MFQFLLIYIFLKIKKVDLFMLWNNNIINADFRKDLLKYRGEKYPTCNIRLCYKINS